jgi:hypothetical protein
MDKRTNIKCTERKAKFSEIKYEMEKTVRVATEEVKIDAYIWRKQERN